MKNVKKILATFIAFLLVFSTSVSADTQDYAYVKEAIRYISEYYKFDVTQQKLEDIALKTLLENKEAGLEEVLRAMLSSLDPNSSYLSKEEYKNLYSSSISGKICGIGVHIVEVNGRVIVKDAIKGSPAEAAGVLANDIIVEVDSQNVEGKSVAEIQALVTGEEGTKVLVTFLRGEQRVTFDITRASIENTYVEYEVMDKIGYIEISSFNNSILKDVNKALSEFSAKGIEKIVLDLRNNTGGSFDAALDICDLFAPEGVIARIEYNSKNKDENELYYSKTQAPDYDLAILINGGSASASELVAGTLSDTNIAKTFGTKSYGKGTVQTLRPIVTGGAIRLTIAEYKTSGGRTIHQRGIKPDFYIENTYEKIDTSHFEDMELTKTLAEGDSGKGVLALEQRLESLGYMEEYDQVFDEETEKAVKTFQAYAGLSATGIADAYTLVKLNDIEYSELEELVDNQLFAALDYLKGLK